MKGATADKIIIFAQKIVEEFNSARTNPLLYADKIEQHMKMVDVMKTNQKAKIHFYNNDNYPKINLAKGEQAFKECIKILRNLKQTKPLELVNELAIQPPDKPEHINSKEIMVESFKNKRQEVGDNYKHLGFHYDNGALNAEISAILQIVDDNNSNTQRRSNILNPKYKYVGVSAAKVKVNRYYIYLTFAG